ncbi:hypothetical protein JCM19046_145 [Bacillus sp. JCM 19046]|uniref:Uncharacterized protein n=1 Tax=Shouchella xiaoxiensis TaxID=766895 RepID=A0ABS2SXM7_9BACI|nr:hypothetical protein [Shouchella xiaoxiensis]MBM7839214.1 hypothetical protein [Shouchella xiaoxiensis]GAF15107.1 hypothetical protein JCM19045_4452 [Bacillus sp. JCM 19045]GAF15748.1 hypothetical protein JCM19046_145 [Bacillus sp. JCM 19046]
MKISRLFIWIICLMQLTVLIHITILDGAWSGLVLAFTTVLSGFALVAYGTRDST